MNLFLNTRRLTSAKEDHLTEFFAACIEVDPVVREAYSVVLLQDFAKKQGWSDYRIEGVETQVSFTDMGCRPDLKLILQGGRTIVCEHKITAQETVAVTDDEESRQLRRYLDLPVDGVAYVRATWSKVDLDVLNHPRYVRPPNNVSHFLWRDFFGVLSKGKTFVAEWMTKGFRQLGFTPPHAPIGELSYDSDTRENRENFEKLWTRTRVLAKDHGWKVGRGSICQLYLTNNPSSIVKILWLNPIENGGTILRIRLTPRRSTDLPLLLEAVTEVLNDLPWSVEVEEARIRRVNGQLRVLDITIPLAELFEGLGLVTEYGKRLEDYVEVILGSIHAGFR